MKRFLISIFFLLQMLCAPAQKQDFQWVFGDSVGLNFNTFPPTVDTNRIIMNLEGSSSIADVNGNLLFYVGTPNANNFLAGALKYVVRNAIDSIMPGGDSLNGHTSITQGSIIIPYPNDTTKYYIFHIRNGSNQLYYSNVDMTYNNGLGAVISANNFLINYITEKLHAVKAANGKDWWLLGVRYSQNTRFQKFKIDSLGISNKGFQIYSQLELPAGQMIFSRKGDKIVTTDGPGDLYIFDFDRCTGQISNMVIVDQVGYQSKYGCSFSPSGRYIYASNLDSIWQYDTQAANIAASKYLLFNVPVSGPKRDYKMGQHMLGPDGKIYIANISTLTSIDSLNTHLSIIQNPDSPAVACNFTPYSFSLLGRKPLGSMPNMVNYNLGQLEAVNCDSILAVSVDEFSSTNFSVYPNPANASVTISWSSNFRDNSLIELYSITGVRLIQKIISTNTQQMQLDISHLDAGCYFLKMVDEGGIGICKKVVVVK